MEIRFEEEKQRSAAYVEGKEIGESTYSNAADLWIIDHTYVEKAYNGQGIARKLVDTIVENARSKGIQLMATCPYALKLFETNPEYADVYKR
ncbi:MAG: GNAT family N-acetyltransferase [Peptoniphilus sp.]|nr:GNAT family N-acetyltransferase [Peptoniphilus sp.]MDY3118404.1 GNAT family N-acetyltransferase [Peptoniphilus sp.]